jgi:hypothetical protein
MTVPPDRHEQGSTLYQESDKVTLVSTPEVTGEIKPWAAAAEKPQKDLRPTVGITSRTAPPVEPELTSTARGFRASKSLWPLLVLIIVGGAWVLAQPPQVHLVKPTNSIWPELHAMAPPPPPNMAAMHMRSALDLAGQFAQHNGMEANLASSKLAAPFSRLDHDAIAAGLTGSIEETVDDLTGSQQNPNDAATFHILSKREDRGRDKLAEIFKITENSLREMGPTIIPDLENYAKQPIPESANYTDPLFAEWKREICCRVIASFGEKGTDALLRIADFYGTPPPPHSVDQFSFYKEAMQVETLACLIDNGHAFQTLSERALHTTGAEKANALYMLDVLIDRAVYKKLKLPHAMEQVLREEISHPPARVSHNEPVSWFIRSRPLTTPRSEPIQELGCVDNLSEDSVQFLTRVISDNLQDPNLFLSTNAAQSIALVLQRTEGTAHQLSPATRNAAIAALRNYELHSPGDAFTPGPQLDVKKATVAELVEKAFEPAGIDTGVISGVRVITANPLNNWNNIRELCGPVKPAD